jgi:hypothetical protein
MTHHTTQASLQQQSLEVP